EQARSQPKIAPDVQKLIREDAEQAQKDPASAADGYYALGQLEEALGQWDKAEKNYRQALAAHKGTPDEGSRYRVALARILLRDRPFTVEPAEVEPKKVGEAPEKSPEVPQEEEASLDSL